MYLIHIKSFRYLTPCNLLRGASVSKKLPASIFTSSENESTSILQKDGNYLSKNTALETTPQFLYSSPKRLNFVRWYLIFVGLVPFWTPRILSSYFWYVCVPHLNINDSSRTLIFTIQFQHKLAYESNLPSGSYQHDIR
jgi:hypothetical protein